MGETAGMIGSNAVVLVVSLVVGLLAINGVVWAVLLTYIRRRMKQGLAMLRSEVQESGEQVVLGPVSGLYRGGTGPWPRVKGNAAIVLTDRRLVIDRLVGDRIEVARGIIKGVRNDKWFLRAYVGGRVHVIVETVESELGFFVPDHGAWTEALRGTAA